MTPAQFISKWKGNPLSERAGAQSHFLDLCDLLKVDKPTDIDNYCFERGATRTGAGNGWADVWKRNCFAWEYKGPDGDLGKALKQLMTYALALDNPPLLVVSDRELIEIHTHFTGTPSETYTFHIDELTAPEVLQKLRWLFTEPDRFRPAKTIRQVTEEAASKFAHLAVNLAKRGVEPQRAAHFLNKCLFAMFAEDVELLANKLFTQLLQAAVQRPGEFVAMMRDLFKAMRKGGRIGFEPISWFNGGLFDNDDAIELNQDEIKMLLEVADMDWSQIEPSILGTLFERGLDPQKRSQLGAHYTDPGSIMRIVSPVVLEPLRAEWEACKVRLAELAPKFGWIGKKRDKQNEALRTGNEIFFGFLGRLRDFRVLDPACGSGNFLYLALKALKDLEHRVNLEAETFGLQRHLAIEVCPANVMGIEINDYAAELARVTVWIGEIQWMLAHGYPIRRDPILAKLDHIEHRDALLNNDGSEAEWPAADAIVGNPPFLGDKKMRSELGDAYVDALRGCYEGRVPGGADLVTYWFEKARAAIESGTCTAAGLVATNSIRGGANRRVLDRITDTTAIFEAWSDEDWVNEGADVRVSLVCFGTPPPRQLDGNPVAGINADLTPAGLDLTQAKRLSENRSRCFYATVKAGKFDIDGATARSWLSLPNPNGKPNSDVVKPWANAMEVTRRPTDKWVVDFGVDMPLEEAALYEAPFHHVLQKVKPERDKTRRDKYRNVWWLFAEPIPGMRAALQGLGRYIATPAVAKHRLFVWMPVSTVPDHALMVVAREDDEAFGILHSRFHELWALGLCTWLGVGNDPRYTPTSTFETFPFPDGLTLALDPASYTNPHRQAIADAAKRLNELRQEWLNPSAWVDHVPEAVEGYPNRVIPKAAHEKEVRNRTLTNLYNAMPPWLAHAHENLDKAVAAAYGWTDYAPAMPDDEILHRLLALNLERANS